MRGVFEKVQASLKHIIAYEDKTLDHLSAGMGSLFLCALLTSCKTKYVTVPEYHIQYVARTDTVEKTDSFYRKDSVYIYQRGDTIFKDRLVLQNRYRYLNKVKTDSFIKRDTIYVPKPMVRELSKAEQRYITLGKYTARIIWTLVVAVIGLLIWLWHRKK